jgi:hypothetical protein
MFYGPMYVGMTFFTDKIAIEKIMKARGEICVALLFF